MKTHVTKAIFFGFLLSAVFGSLTTATSDSSAPEIGVVEPWPEDPDHGEEIYVDVEVTEDETSVEDVWMVVRSEGDRLRSGSLVDSNNDGYYVSPVAFTADGSETYEITVNACDSQDNCSSNKVEVDPSCSLDIVQKCFY